MYGWFSRKIMKTFIKRRYPQLFSLFLLTFNGKTYIIFYQGVCWEYAEIWFQLALDLVLYSTAIIYLVITVELAASRLLLINLNFINSCTELNIFYLSVVTCIYITRNIYYVNWCHWWTRCDYWYLRNELSPVTKSSIQLDFLKNQLHLKNNAL